MTDQAAYRRYTAEAERLLEQAATPVLVNVDREITQQEADELKDALGRHGLGGAVVAPPSLTIDLDATLRAAQAWATLALAAAQDRVQPADRPSDAPPYGPGNPPPEDDHEHS